MSLKFVYFAPRRPNINSKVCVLLLLLVQTAKAVIESHVRTFVCDRLPLHKYVRSNGETVQL